MTNSLVGDIEKDLLTMVDEDYKEGMKSYFKGAIENYGVRTGKVRKLASRYFKKIKDKSKSEIFEICEKLLDTDISENRTIAFQWVHKIVDRYEAEDFTRFEKWVEKYVNNWGACDDLCTHALGELVCRYPSLVSNLKEWTKSENMWFRRASAVTMIYSLRKGSGLNDALEIADLLFSDEEDLVQKGYGWMLKEASNKHPRDVFDYVMGNKETMPRTALRYAIEKLPPKWRKKAME